MSIPERITWAVRPQLPALNAARVLEIGCGSGHALALMATRLTRARIVGIDRSALQVRQARERLRALPEAQRPQVEKLTLAEAATRWAPAAFDAILAINVNVFWTEPVAALAAMAALLAPRGSACLVYEPPAAERLATLRCDLPLLCEQGGLRVHAVREAPFSRGHGLGIAVGRGRIRSMRPS